MSKILLKYNKISNEIRDIEKKKKYTQKIKLIAVSKTFFEKDIKPLLNSGHKIFGENKVQEASIKWIDLKKKYNDVELHLIGPLQSNKVLQALEVFDCIQTLDREKIARKISKILLENDKLRQKNHEIMIQVNTGNETQKSGVALESVQEFSSWCVNDLKLNITGLMCIPPISEDPKYHFRLLKDLTKTCQLTSTSMGMSSDYIEAIEYGASHIRVGSAIFGERVNTT